MIKFVKHMRRSYKRREEKLKGVFIYSYLGLRKGYILVIVLIISAFLVGLTSNFIYKSSNFISVMTRLKDDTKSEFIAYSGFEIAKAVLDIDRLGLSSSFMKSLNNNKKIDSYQDIWALELPPLQIEDGLVKIEIEDENSKINLSAMANKYVEKSPYYGIVQRFFFNMGFSAELADIIIDWVDPDDMRFPYGAESAGYYLNRTPPYRAKNSELDSIEELLMMKDITPGIFYGISGGNIDTETDIVENNRGKINISDNISEKFFNEKVENSNTEAGEVKIGPEKSRKLSDYLRAYGNGNDFTDKKNKINVNTASYRVLSSFSDSMSKEIVEEIIRKRQAAPFTSIEDFNKLAGEDSNYGNIAGVSSHIFRIKITSLYNSGRSILTIYYDRDDKKKLYWSLHH